MISEEDISPSKWFPLFRQKVRLPNGRIVDDYYLSRLGDVAIVVPITSRGEMVLVRQYKHAIREIVLELPAGMRKEGTSIEQSAVEELEEEVGIRVPTNKLIPLGKLAGNPTKIDQIVYGFLANNLDFNSEQKLDQNEEIDIIKVKPSEALEMIKSGGIWAGDSAYFIIKAYLNYPEIFK